MPRLLIKDAHEWTNEIPSVPTYYNFELNTILLINYFHARARKEN